MATRRITDEEEPSARIRPGRPRRAQQALRRPLGRSGFGGGLGGTVTRLLRMARASSQSRHHSASPKERWTDSLKQRATVTVRYTKSGMKGQWCAHGKYVERESSGAGAGKSPGDRVGEAKTRGMNETLGDWQNQGDERLWKIIVSPERGEEVDFDLLAEDLIEHLEREVGSLQWAGVVHRNTDHPHLHIAIRGVREDGTALRFSREQIQRGMRNQVRSELTRQLGFRTHREIEVARERETENERVTQIDRDISARLDTASSDDFQTIQPQSWLEQKRLLTLEKLQLATNHGEVWQIRSHFLNDLQDLQVVRDRGRALFRSGVAISDDKLPTEILTRTRRFAGRVLLNSEEEVSGQMQTAFETLDGKITFIRHDAAIRSAWIRGDLEPGNVVVADTLKSDATRFYVALLGVDADLLNDPKMLGKVVERLRRQGLMPKEMPTQNGWIGKFFRGIESLEREHGISL